MMISRRDLIYSLNSRTNAFNTGIGSFLPQEYKISRNTFSLFNIGEIRSEIGPIEETQSMNNLMNNNSESFNFNSMPPQASYEKSQNSSFFVDYSDQIYKLEVEEDFVNNASKADLLMNQNNASEACNNDVITINGETGVWINKADAINWQGPIPLSEYTINEDSNPEIIRKKSEQELVYNQEIAIRYLRPPTPPPPGDIIIREERTSVAPPAPPLVIRQQPPRPETPAPLIIRELPPKLPYSTEPKVITLPGKKVPPPPRRVIVERLPPLPAKPQSIIIERWLPYKPQKRKVIYTKSFDSEPVFQKPNNLIIQWEAPKVTIKKEFKDLGIIKANPNEYIERFGAQLKAINEMPEFIREFKIPKEYAGLAGVDSETTQLSPIYELEGDIQALSLVDLDKEGLSEYKSLLKSIENNSKSFRSSSQSQIETLSSKMLKSNLRIKSTGSISSSPVSINSLERSDSNNFSTKTLTMDEAKRILFALNAKIGRQNNDPRSINFLNFLEQYPDDKIDVNDLKQSLKAYI